MTNANGDTNKGGMYFANSKPEYTGTIASTTDYAAKQDDRAAPTYYDQRFKLSH